MIKGAGGNIFLPISIQSHTAQKSRNRNIQTVSGFLCFVVGVFLTSSAGKSASAYQKTSLLWGENRE